MRNTRTEELAIALMHQQGARVPVNDLDLGRMAALTPDALPWLEELQGAREMQEEHEEIRAENEHLETELEDAKADNVTLNTKLTDLQERFDEMQHRLIGLEK